MKKLMIAAAIVCAAAVSQAATADWAVSYVYDHAAISATTPSYTLANGYAAYFVVASEVFGVDEAKAAVAARDFSWMAAEKTQNATLNEGAATSTTPEWFGNGDTVNAFMVIFDNANYKNADYAYVSQIQTDKTGGEGTPASLSFMEYGSATPSTWTKMESVPEPTSGLLLLLGVAGLALRRRRA